MTTFCTSQFLTNQRNSVNLLGVYLDQISALFAAIKSLDQGNSDVSSLCDLGKFLADQQYDFTDELAEEIDRCAIELENHNVSHT